jgi:HEAT repeat protein
MDPEGADRALLERMLRDDASAEVRQAAAESLAEGNAFEVTPPLLGALADPDPGVVAAAVRGLEDVYDEAPDPRIRQKIAGLREHRDADVREAVEEFESWVEE